MAILQVFLANKKALNQYLSFQQEYWLKNKELDLMWINIEISIHLQIAARVKFKDCDNYFG